MKQLVFIHGGNTFESYERYLETLLQTTLDYDRLKPSSRWTDDLPTMFPGVDILMPSMPNKQNAQYREWEIMLEKVLELVDDDACLVGHSLGAMLLAKYFSEHTEARQFDTIVLLGAGYDDDSLEDLGEFKLHDISSMQSHAKRLVVVHSQDDPVVPFTEFAKVRADLPSAEVFEFADKNHFLDPTFPEFPRLVRGE